MSGAGEGLHRAAPASRDAFSTGSPQAKTVEFVDPATKNATLPVVSGTHANRRNPWRCPYCGETKTVASYSGHLRMATLCRTRHKEEPDWRASVAFLHLSHEEQAAIWARSEFGERMPDPPADWEPPYFEPGDTILIHHNITGEPTEMAKSEDDDDGPKGKSKPKPKPKPDPVPDKDGGGDDSESDSFRKEHGDFLA